MPGKTILWAAGLCAAIAPAAHAGIAEALAAADQADWAAAEAAIAGQGEVAADLVAWTRLRAGVGTFEEYLDFVTTHRDWPRLTQLRRMGERQITAQTPRAAVLAYFGSRHAGTAHGALHLADALNAAGRFEDARAEIVLAWRMLPFSRSEQAIFQREFKDLIAPHNFARLDRLLWRGQHDQAERMYPFLTPGERALARARIVLRSKGRGVDARIKAVPKELEGDAGLAFERFLWRFERGRRKGAEDLILERSISAGSLGRPAFWASPRRSLARDALREGRDQTAYDLAANHHLTFGNDFADLEWLAGYIALTRLDQPDVALRHFRRFRAGIDSPISLGRSAYWESRAYAALDRPDDARVALEFASEFQTGFYGQLAAEEIGAPMVPHVYETRPKSVAGAGFLKDPKLLAGLMLARIGRKPEATLFFTEIFDRLGPDEQERLGDLTVLLGEPHIAVALAKAAAVRGDLLPRPYFPVTELSASDVPDEIVLSIIRRESEFNPGAVSGAGAQGLMQLMPPTAREVSGQLNVPYRKAKLIEDPDYNMRLGTEYLRQLRKEFDDNIILVASAYNAGPGRTRSWIRAYGDPRKKSVDVLDWIESIPFRETRNYVMRVAESVVVYRARLHGGPQEIRLMEEIID